MDDRHRQQSTIREVQPKDKTGLSSSLTRWVGLAAIVAGVLLATGLLAGLLYQGVSTAIDARRYPPPGRIVEVSGHKMHLECRGPSGTGPTVVLNAGLGDDSQVWWSVAPRVAGFAHVCAFDRAGYGWSEYDGASVTAEDENKTLHLLLESAGVEPPYVMVGHSLGGTYAYGYARQYPKAVAGLVLVDPADDSKSGGFEDWLRANLTTEERERFERAVQKGGPSGESASRAMGSLMRVAPALAPFGVMRLILAFTDSEPDYLPARLAKVENALRSRTGYWKRFVEEQKAAPQVVASVYAQKAPLGDKPAVILASKPQDATPTFAESAVQRWRMSRLRKLAGSSSRGRTEVAEKSGHYIQVDDPDLVVRAIRDVVEAAR